LAPPKKRENLTDTILQLSLVIRYASRAGKPIRILENVFRFLGFLGFRLFEGFKVFKDLAYKSDWTQNSDLGGTPGPL